MRLEQCNISLSPREPGLRTRDAHLQLNLLADSASVPGAVPHAAFINVHRPPQPFQTANQNGSQRLPGTIENDGTSSHLCQLLASGVKLAPLVDADRSPSTPPSAGGAASPAAHADAPAADIAATEYPALPSTPLLHRAQLFLQTDASVQLCRRPQTDVCAAQRGACACSQTGVHRGLAYSIRNAKQHSPPTWVEAVWSAEFEWRDNLKSGR